MERRGVYIRDVYERPIRSTADVEHIEKTFKRYDATFPYRFWHRPADSLAAAGRRETNGLYFAELSLVPANYLNFSSPQMSPLSKTTPPPRPEAAELYGPLLILYGGEVKRRGVRLPVCVFISDPKCFIRTR